MPSLTRSGRPSASLRSRPPSGRQSTVLRAQAIGGRVSGRRQSAELSSRWPGGHRSAAMLDSRRRLGSPVRPRYAGLLRYRAAPSPWSAARRRPRSHERRRRQHHSSRGTRAAPIPFAPPQAALPAPSRRAAGASPRSASCGCSGSSSASARLAIVSTIFGMMMAVASDLPQIENRAEYKHLGANSYLYDDHWRKIGIFAPANSEVDRHLSTAGADGHGRGRRRSRTSASGPTPASTSRASPAPSSPTSPAAPARARPRSPSSSSRTPSPPRTTARCSRSCARRRWPTTSPAEWTKKKILTEYLNSIYFGNGAYGAESAARVYFGKLHGYDPRRRRAPRPTPTRAAGTRRCPRAPRC